MTLPGDAPRPVAGGLYSHLHGDRPGYGVLKVLAIDEVAVHVRLYANSFAERPAAVAGDELTLGRIDIERARSDPDYRPPPFGIGHVPVSHATFAGWQARLIGIVPVTDDELEGYRQWFEGNGGVFGLD